ncbi:MAG: hypothetical protein ABSB24_17815 [Gaiellaceae bacterium]
MTPITTPAASSDAAMTPRLPPAGASGLLALAARASDWLSRTMEAGGWMLVNRDHAPCQPSGVSGHHSIGCVRGPPAAQIP